MPSSGAAVRRCSHLRLLLSCWRLPLLLLRPLLLLLLPLLLRQLLRLPCRLLCCCWQQRDVPKLVHKPEGRQKRAHKHQPSALGGSAAVSATGRCQCALLPASLSQWLKPAHLPPARGPCQRC